MQRRFGALLIVAVAAVVPANAFASGSVPATKASTREAFSRANLHSTQGAKATANAKPEIAEEPYELGKVLFSGKSHLGHPKLTTVNIAEKKQRLVTLRRTLPAAERTKLDVDRLSPRLTDHEMNALEYYVGMRFGKFITKAPSWAKAEPPPKVALSK